MSAVTKKKFTPASKASGMTFGTPTRPRQIGLTPTGDVPSWYLSVRRGHVRRAAAAERRGALEPRLLLRGEETTFADRVMYGAVGITSTNGKPQDGVSCSRSIARYRRPE